MKLAMTGIFLGVLSGCATTGTEVKCDAHLSRINPAPPGELAAIRATVERTNTAAPESAPTANAAISERSATEGLASTDREFDFAGEAE
jgi:hypothetical protein